MQKVVKDRERNAQYSPLTSQVCLAIDPASDLFKTKHNIKRTSNKLRGNLEPGTLVIINKYLLHNQPPARGISYIK